MHTNRIPIPDRPLPGSPTAALSLGVDRGGSEMLATVDKRNRRNLREPFEIGTWNVRSLSQSGKVELLATELDNIRWNIVGLSEMRWTGTGEYFTEEGHKVWYCGLEKKKQHRVGFIGDKKTAGSVLQCNPVSERIISIRVASKPFNTTIIQVYVPTCYYEDQVVEEFNDNLEETIINKTPKKDILIVMGDWNAQIGAGEKHKAAGKFGYCGTSERGTKPRNLRKSRKW